MTDLSVIIPIYNTPIPMLQRCFASVAALTGITWEALLIDDGSQAETGTFCKDFCQDNPNFRYVYQENGGVSAARNKGLSLACGQFLTFLDADDALLTEAITSDLLAENRELVLFDILLDDQGAESVWSAFEAPAGAVTQQQLLCRLVASKSLNGPVAKLYKRSVIDEHALRFNEGFITGEDWNFVCDYALCVQDITYRKDTVYRYFRDGATSLGRLARQPDVMLSNHLDMYARKLTLADLTDDPTALKNIAARDLVETLFNIAADLLLLKALTDQRKATIQATVAKLSLAAASRKTRIKAAVICKHFYCLRPLALLRRLYLKRKH